MTRSFLAQRLGGVPDPGQRQSLLVIGHLNCVDDIGRNGGQMKGVASGYHVRPPIGHVGGASRLLVVLIIILLGIFPSFVCALIRIVAVARNPRRLARLLV